MSDMPGVKHLVTMMLASTGPSEIDPRDTWALHHALWGLHNEAGRAGRLGAWRTALIFKPCPDVGLRAIGADEALFKLWRERAFEPNGFGRGARLRLVRDTLTVSRRHLLAMDPADAQLIYRAGATWAAMVRTNSKKSSTPPEFSAGTVPSSTPNRRHPLSVAKR
jgi:hypothetical protein